MGGVAPEKGLMIKLIRSQRENKAMKGGRGLVNNRKGIMRSGETSVI